jgi:oxygen-independent coproporphyrinogen-3 oxidase
MVDYVAACLAEMARAYDDGLGPAETVFVGGGTPSLLPPALLAELLSGVRRAPGAEVTVECNPESTTMELLEELRSVGVDRISLGVQSVHAHVLAGLGRHHVPGAVERAVGLVGEAGFRSFNVDLVYGGAGEGDRDWQETLDAVLALEPSPPHVSAYALTVEAGTPLARDAARHPDDDVQADRYETLDTILADAGLDWYELSNFARPGHECRHNAACWRQEDYRGFGCAAHSHEAGRRSWNIRSVERYIAAARADGIATAGAEVLDPERRALERLELALRTRAGVPAGALPPLEQLGDLVERTGDRVVLSRRGRLLANEVLVQLRVP